MSILIKVSYDYLVIKSFEMRILLCFLVFSFGSNLCAQYDGNYRNKVKTLDSTIETLYAVISGEKGEARNWDLFTYLFAENAQLIPIGMNSHGKSAMNYLSPEDYIEMAGDYLLQNGFFEKEIYRVTESYGAMTHMFSTYESYRSASDEKPFARGINSIQAMFDGDRWYIVNIYWQAETLANPLPAKYLPK